MISTKIASRWKPIYSPIERYMCNSSNYDITQFQPSSLCEEESRSFKWDSSTGQFSYSQGQEHLLQKALSVLEDLSLHSPDKISMIQRQYCDNKCKEVGVTYSNLQNRVHSISDLYSYLGLESNDNKKIVLLYLPLSLLSVATILASTLSQIRLTFLS